MYFDWTGAVLLGVVAWGWLVGAAVRVALVGAVVDDAPLADGAVVPAVDVDPADDPSAGELAAPDNGATTADEAGAEGSEVPGGADGAGADDSACASKRDACAAIDAAAVES